MLRGNYDTLPKCCLLVCLLWLTVFRLAHAEPIYQRQNLAGQSLDGPVSNWACVRDLHSGLVWEVKSRKPGLHHYQRTFSWYEPASQANGGLPGTPGATDCAQPPCDTHGLVQAVNAAGWCGAHDWRLPSREELRSLVDYAIPYPGPALDSSYFPNALPQFYWSASPAAGNPEEAWGIGFAFGFDYAYPKSNRAWVRLVRGHLTAGKSECSTTIPASTPAQRFQIHEDGTATDLASGLRWQRCPLGQQWVSDHCQGEAQYFTWSETRQAIAPGWRLPSLRELSGIVELACTAPASNHQVFSTPATAGYWSATAVAGRPGQYWQVLMRYGENNPSKGEAPALVRLVRDN